MDFANLLTPELQNLALGLFAMSGLRLALGVYAAAKDGTFVLSSVADFLRSQVLGRVFPIMTTALFAQGTGNGVLIAAAAAAGAAYLGETVGAIQEALSASAREVKAEKVVHGLEVGNPVP